MKKVAVEFILKLGIIGVMAVIIGILDVFIEVHFNKDMTPFGFYTLGYVSCLICNWRWFIYAENKKR